MYHFEENDVVMPIAVLEELDQSKKGNEPPELPRAGVRPRPL